MSLLLARLSSGGFLLAAMRAAQLNPALGNPGRFAAAALRAAQSGVDTASAIKFGALAADWSQAHAAKQQGSALRFAAMKLAQAGNGASGVSLALAGAALSVQVGCANEAATALRAGALRASEAENFNAALSSVLIGAARFAEAHAAFGDAVLVTEPIALLAAITGAQYGSFKAAPTVLRAGAMSAAAATTASATAMVRRAVAATLEEIAQGRAPAIAFAQLEARLVELSASEGAALAIQAGALKVVANADLSLAASIAHEAAMTTCQNGETLWPLTLAVLVEAAADRLIELSADERSIAIAANSTFIVLGADTRAIDLGATESLIVLGSEQRSIALASEERLIQ